MDEAAGRLGARLRPRLLLLVGALLMAAGLAAAALVERASGVSVSDVRWTAADGTRFSALLFRPRTATPEHPAPGIVAVHGYVNTRETQSAFAIEFARRGYVVLAPDQRGHGYSGGQAATLGFGGPEALRYLRALPFVDRGQIGLEGHSMGGWSVLAAARAYPDAYRAMVLEGSSTGKPFAADGTAAWPRNLEVVYSRFDEFAPLMWGVPRARDVGASPKLKTLFATAAPVVPGRLYGDPAALTARRLTQPVTTHPGDHLSLEAVADAADWFALTLKGGRARPRSDQIWPLKEAGTGAALVGIGVFALGLFDLLLGLSPFAFLRGPASRSRPPRTSRFLTLCALTTFTPAVTFYALPLGLALFPPSALFPQSITNTLALWALINVLLGLVFARLLAAPQPPRPRIGGAPRLLAAAGLGALAFACVYAVPALAGLAQVDLRFWVLALKPMSLRQALAAVVYLPVFTLFVFASMRVVGSLTAGTGRAQYLFAPALMATGFLLVTGAQYATLFATGALPLPFEALNAIVGLQFVPLLAFLGVCLAHGARRTGDALPAALLTGPLITWCMVAGTATHAL